ncbi:hypothetical protein D3C77_475010 [compost metagenome]
MHLVSAKGNKAPFGEQKSTVAKHDLLNLPFRGRPYFRNCSLNISNTCKTNLFQQLWRYTRGLMVHIGQSICAFGQKKRHTGTGISSAHQNGKLAFDLIPVAIRANIHAASEQRDKSRDFGNAIAHTGRKQHRISLVSSSRFPLKEYRPGCGSSRCNYPVPGKADAGSLSLLPSPCTQFFPRNSLRPA